MPETDSLFHSSPHTASDHNRTSCRGAPHLSSAPTTAAGVADRSHVGYALTR